MPETRDTLIIEAARPADVPAIRALLQQAGLPHEDFAAHRADFLVARQDGAVVGAVGFEQYGHDALLRSLVVAPGWQGDGLGGALLKRIENVAQRQGVRDFYLLTTTAEHFFAKRWFKKIAREKVPPAIAATGEFSHLCPASSICMSRTVKP
ncbi:MAG: GNAT family N-acetyltransferase [Opitutae bacterium]|nr:GNAT family N-acetyltransferase [Opitutae bacterium]